jgi:AraC family transcriptional regulator
VASSERSRAEYQRRVNQVLDHVRAHLSEELTLDRLAEVASFSPFHFHRIFKSITGETLKEHIQRVRLESAATALTHRPSADVLEIAMDSGFESASGFARAFRERFGMSATEWRAATCGRNPGTANSNPGQAQGKHGKAAASAAHHPVLQAGHEARPESEDIMDVRVETLPPYRIAYLTLVGAYGPGGDIGGLWQRLARWAQARDLWTADRICFGISHDNPHVTDPARCRYDAAIAVPHDLRVDGDVNVAELAGGKYALGRFGGRAEELGRAYDELFGRWLPGSGFQPDNRPIFELYGANPLDEKTGRFTLDLCVPIRPL